MANVSVDVGRTVTASVTTTGAQRKVRIDLVLDEATLQNPLLRVVLGVERDSGGGVWVPAVWTTIEGRPGVPAVSHSVTGIGLPSGTPIRGFVESNVAFVAGVTTTRFA